VAARIDVLNGVPILAERAMYLTRPGADWRETGSIFEAGHAACAVAAPALSWYFAEGATGGFFDFFVLLANPDDSPARVTGTYLLPGGDTYSKTYTVAAGARLTIWVDQQSFDGVPGLPLRDAGAVSATFDVESGPPIVAERAMWWPGPTPQTWTEAHASAGATATASRWVAAAGHVADGGGERTDTYYLLANPGHTPIEAAVTLLYDGGWPPESRTFPVAARSRFTVDVRAEFPASVGRHFSALVEGDGGGLVVEWAMYRDAVGRFWASGASAPATPWP
jgi:hypothetical protein